MILTKLEDEDGYCFCIHSDKRTYFSDTIQECLAEIKRLGFDCYTTIPEEYRIIYQIEFKNPDDLLELVPEEFL